MFDDDLDGDEDWTTSLCCDVVLFRNASNFNAIATTYTWVDTATHTIILASDTVFWDARMKFFTHYAGTCKRGYFVEGVTAHERGHSLGSAHSTVTAATMYPSTSRCNASIETLDIDDENMLRELYPDGTVVTPPAAPSGLTATLDAVLPSAQVINLLWVDNSNDEDRFVVERSLDPTNFQYLGQTTGPDIVTYADTSVQPDTTYWYRVFAQNAGGLSLLPSNVDSATTVTAPNNPPTANAGGPYSGTVGQSIAFSGSGSSDPDLDALTYAWDFGDGNVGSGAQPTHTYSSDGNFTVTLTVNDGNGGTDSDTALATVQVPSAITLTATGYKVQGRQRVDLIWTGATSSTVKIKRDGVTIATVANDPDPNPNSYTDNINKRGGGSYAYQVCASETGPCSDTATVTF